MHSVAWAGVSAPGLGQPPSGWLASIPTTPKNPKSLVSKLHVAVCPKTAFWPVFMGASVLSLKTFRTTRGLQVTVRLLIAIGAPQNISHILQSFTPLRRSRPAWCHLLFWGHRITIAKVARQE